MMINKRFENWVKDMVGERQYLDLKENTKGAYGEAMRTIIPREPISRWAYVCQLRILAYSCRQFSWSVGLEKASILNRLSLQLIPIFKSFSQMERK